MAVGEASEAGAIEDWRSPWEMDHMDNAVGNASDMHVVVRVSQICDPQTLRHCWAIYGVNCLDKTHAKNGRHTWLTVRGRTNCVEFGVRVGECRFLVYLSIRDKRLSKGSVAPSDIGFLLSRLPSFFVRERRF